MKKTNLIIGAGPAGLFCGHELKKENQEFVILEINDFVGGLAATHTLNGLPYEIGPHILFTTDDYIKEIAQSYLDDDLIKKEWNVGQLVEGTLLKFPNTISDMTSKLGVIKMKGFLLSYLRYRGLNPSNFTEFLYSKVGKKLAEFSVINYTEKMWGIPLDDLETEWIKPRLERFSIKEIIKNTIKPKNRDYLYPRQGAGQLYDKMSHNSDIRMEEYPIKIKHHNNQITEVTSNKNNYSIDQLYSSISLVNLLDVLYPEPPAVVVEAARQLIHRSQIYVVLSINKSPAIEYQWIYFNDKEVPFCRVHEPKNFTDIDTTPDRSLLVVEYFCFYDDELWNSSDQAIYDQTVLHLEKMKIINAFEVDDFKILKQKDAYPLLNKNRQEHLKTINTYLGQFGNLKLIGRHGLHTYDNQDGAGRSAINAVRTVKVTKNGPSL